MIDEPLSQSLQEDVLCLLCHRNDPGKMIAHLVTADLFEGDYRVIAERVLDFWSTHNAAPNEHTAQLLDDIILDRKNRRAPTFRKVLTQLYELNDSVNVDYVMSSLQLFIRTQRTKQTILKSAERINANPAIALPEIEEMWHELLNSRQLAFDPGLKLTDIERVLTYVNKHQREFRSSVKVFNKLFIVPARQEVLGLIGPPKKGKTWWGVDLTKNALIDRKKVVYCTGELSAENLALRCYQALFAASKREGESKFTTLVRNELKRLSGFSEKVVQPTFSFDDDKNIRAELGAALSAFGSRIENLRIMEFAAGSLSIPMLEAYLDNLETTERFKPDLIVLDQLVNTKTNPATYRLDLGRNVVLFKGLCHRRNMAGALLHQGSKLSELSGTTRGHQSAEDYSVLFTCDVICTLSQTDGERQFGLARLLVDRARNERSGYTALITQDLNRGQFCLDSILIAEHRYKAMVEELIGQEEQTDQDEADVD